MSTAYEHKKQFFKALSKLGVSSTDFFEEKIRSAKKPSSRLFSSGYDFHIILDRNLNYHNSIKGSDFWVKIYTQLRDSVVKTPDEPSFESELGDLVCGCADCKRKRGEL